jgi:hypothetical protein
VFRSSRADPEDGDGGDEGDEGDDGDAGGAEDEKASLVPALDAIPSDPAKFEQLVLELGAKSSDATVEQVRSLRLMAGLLVCPPPPDESQSQHQGLSAAAAGAGGAVVEQKRPGSSGRGVRWAQTLEEGPFSPATAARKLAEAQAAGASAEQLARLQAVKPSLGLAVQQRESGGVAVAGVQPAVSAPRSS